MKCQLAGTALALLLVNGTVTTQERDVVATAGAPIRILPVSHGTVAIIRGTDVILVDPARFVPGQPEPPRQDLQDMAKAFIARFGPPPPPSRDREPDPALLVSALPVRPEQIARFRLAVGPPSVVLVTDTHTDHLDPRAIAALQGAKTRVIVPMAAKDRLLDLQAAEAMANGDRVVIEGLTIEAVAMYNTEPDSQSGLVWHQKGRGNGYVINLSGTRVYVAGDTACTPEMKALVNIDVAFVPMNLPYTMSPAEAATCVKVFKPRVVYPYHYFGSDLAVFAAELRDSGIEVRLRDWYAKTP
jgi:L-ascorbate metabolism protein UlaG (beta-lactamase superfamily)